MLSSLHARCITVAACLALSACTGSTKSQSDSAQQSTSASLAVASQTLGLGANMVPVENEQLLQDLITENDAGASGVGVDCIGQLPCEWVSADTQFSVTITNAANIATRSRLSIQLSMLTYHDTDILLSRADDLVDSAGTGLKHTDQKLNGTSQTLINDVNAGIPMEATLDFSDRAIGRLLPMWTVEFLDGGVLRQAIFTNIPVGTITTQQADCQFTLPCVWTTPERNVAIALHTASASTAQNELSVGFSVETREQVSVAVDDGSMANGIDGTAFESRSHTLASVEDHRLLTALTTVDVPLQGSVTFYKTEHIPASLEALSLAIFNNQPVPQWNPRFVNVPVQ